ncbi:MAG: iron-sulfur cluster assembly accessory protein [Deltaproteobacteria bacterium]|nr:iron-sulfur cluster assembly accessory protein [Deltaproteobacteria bacterium]
MAGTEIKLSETAANEIRNLIAQEGLNGDVYLRLGVSEGGCSGLSYQMQFDTSKTDADQVFESHGIKILCDTESYFSLAGIELDYQGGLGGQGFLFKNPNARHSCGCGKSFS